MKLPLDRAWRLAYEKRASAAPSGTAAPHRRNVGEVSNYTAGIYNCNTGGRSGTRRHVRRPTGRKGIAAARGAEGSLSSCKRPFPFSMNLKGRCGSGMARYDAAEPPPDLRYPRAPPPTLSSQSPLRMLRRYGQVSRASASVRTKQPVKGIHDVCRAARLGAIGLLLRSKSTAADRDDVGTDGPQGHPGEH